LRIKIFIGTFASPSKRKAFFGSILDNKAFFSYHCNSLFQNPWFLAKRSCKGISRAVFAFSAPELDWVVQVFLKR